MSEKPESASNVAEYTVSEISGALKRTVEDTFGHVRIRGEISGYRGPHSSGHAYFSLKDDKARIEAVIWRGSMSKLRFQPEEGMEVIATGKLTTYPGSSKYQIVIEQMEPAGAGALMALLEERKRKLGAEGLFDPAAKQLLPFMPRIIGVVTSPTGAVIRDIIHRITDRFPLHVLVWPVRVQGETSGAEVANAINGFNGLQRGGALPRPDVLIVARGGGSLEDLWGFNDEAVVRAVAASQIPLISAVGHETDWTLIDLAADVRAPTPTGAAEMAVPVKADLQATVATLGARLAAGMSRYLDRRRQAQRALARALPSADQLLALPRRHFDETAARLGRALQANTQKKRGEFDGCARQLSPRLLEQRFREKRREINVLTNRLPHGLRVFLRERRGVFVRRAERLSIEPIARLAQRGRQHLQQLDRRQIQAVDLILDRANRRGSELERLMKTLSYQGVLERGFAVVLDPSGTPIKRSAAIASGDDLTLKFQDGEVQAVAKEGDERPSRAKIERPAPAKKPPLPSGSQGSLF
ncbi:exodeoxyribonuclease VII large subunit [Phyllobacterium zundukense]|uniref:Exodeoxyribonuclease 7 large subunit n=1 Tax=Phyllobacterium zundukense TaxID=1867719 RepID=A0A2N9VRV6_9HYPH|nr:exodeoxyribonuclease VII large subunit [Phyllobacterium zundukense]ATU92648.1 exodeoxyribonuclease VII large subunit [Phyllobacterium zundukense]PIO42224.1 exodeoxyribonuclease VII large subunit [Phyllobacterium zundukense]